jgi:hypothetical protein
MATTSVIALTGALLAGTTPFGPVTPPLGISTVQVAIDRAGLALLTQPITWQIELSLDAGATWTPWGAAGCPAGQVTDPISLAVITESSFTISFPRSTDANTRVRGSITTLEPVTTSVTVRMT